MHIMLDLETLSSANDAVIIAIGAMRFNINNFEETDTFYRVVNAKSAQRGGGRVDGDTVMWWMGQSEEARKAICGDDSVLIDTALIEFSKWVREKTLEGMWGNGADFDNVVLRTAYERLNKTAPWSHRENRCYRTMRSLAPDIKRIEPKIPHHALHDAVAQAEHLSRIWKHLCK